MKLRQDELWLHELFIDNVRYALLMNLELLKVGDRLEIMTSDQDQFLCEHCVLQSPGEGHLTDI